MKTAQKGLKVGSETGSLVNWMMSANATAPKVGEGATELMWSDRHPYTVTFVSEDGLSCKIRACKAIPLNNIYETEDQKYEYQEDETQPEIELVFKNGNWRRVFYEIRLTKEWAEKSYEEKKAAGVWGPDGEATWPVLVEGVTKRHRKTEKISIVFGKREEYRDPSF